MKAYMCTSTGLYYPEDYIEQWGRKYGIGLGPHPVSEAWESDYEIPACSPDRNTRRLEDCGHGVRACCAPVVLVDVSQADYYANKAICHRDDPNGEARWDIVRAIQDTNPRSRRKLALMAREL